MSKVKTPSFILELAIVSSPHDEAELNARFETARQLYNACLDPENSNQSIQSCPTCSLRSSFREGESEKAGK